MTTVDDFITLFRGRGDAYGAWEGGCIKQPLTPDHFARHLAGEELIGVYPTVVVHGQAMCVWGCVDIDYDSFEEASLIRRTLEAVNIVSWVERTRKGWHVWVFATALVPAVDMRHMLLAAHQVCELNPKEVNPKQTELARGQVGNYVRLPYPGGLTERRVVDTHGVELTLEEFTSEAMSARTEPKLVAELAGYYVEPPKPIIKVGEPTADLLVAAASLTPLGKLMWRDGPIEGRDRSTTLTHLAHECAKAGLHPSNALQLLRDADERWGNLKYGSRRDGGESVFHDLVLRAYGNIPST